MVNRLVALAPVAFLGVAVLIGGVGGGAVFRKADDGVGVCGMEGIKKFVVLFQLAQIPAVVQVIAADIRQEYQRVFWLQHKSVCHRCV